MVPSLDWFLYAFVRKEAVISSQIEGTQATLIDLLTFEAKNETAVPPPLSCCPSRTDPVFDPSEAVSTSERPANSGFVPIRRRQYPATVELPDPATNGA